MRERKKERKKEDQKPAQRLAPRSKMSQAKHLRGELGLRKNL
jgi:hypothetical protein